MPSDIHMFFVWDKRKIVKFEPEKKVVYKKRMLKASLTTLNVKLCKFAHNYLIYVKYVNM